MAPPAKRRRLSSPVDNFSGETKAAARDGSASFFHGIEHLEAASNVEIPTQRTAQHVEEVHLEIRNQIVAEHARLHPRQGTAGSADATATGADVVVSVVASVDAASSTIGVSTAAAITVDLPNLPSFPATSTTTLVVSPDATSSASSETSSTASSDSDPSSSVSSSSSSFGPTTTGQAGFIGISAGTAATTSAASASVSDLSASNSSSTTTEPATSTGTGGSIIAQSLMSSSNRLNLTTSATTYTSGGSTSTSQSIFDLASLSSQTASRSSHASSSTSSFDAGVIYVATLSGGRVATITRSGRSYATTFPNGQVSTIPPISSSSSSSRQSSSDSVSGSVTEITTGGSTVRSTVYSTFVPSSTQDPASAGANGIEGPVGLGQGTATSAAASSTSSAAGGSGGSSSTPPAGTIAGGVVGGAAGLAVILLIAMMFLRWYRRRSQMGHQALPPNSASLSPDLDHNSSSRGQPGMAERAGLMPFAAAVPALFRHQNRSRESDSAEPATGERGFTRVSGRKLPSAWSEGMTSHPQPTMSPPPTMPLVGGDHDRNLSGTSFYRDSTGHYGGDGGDGRSVSPNPFADLSPIDTNVAQASHDHGEQLVMSPGPQRTPTVHHGGPYVMSPSTASSDARGMLSPGAPPWSAGTTATFARSETPASLDGSRGSRFLEEV